MCCWPKATVQHPHPHALQPDIRYQTVMSNLRCAETDKTETKSKPDSQTRQTDMLPPCSNRDRNKRQRQRQNV